MTLRANCAGDPTGPRTGTERATLCYLRELNDSAQARWLKTVEVFNEHGETHQLKLFPSEVEPPAHDPDVAQVLLEEGRGRGKDRKNPGIRTEIRTGLSALATDCNQSY